jgi:hypothetical protein
VSSAILYLAIVAIWAVVLVPRWLRAPHAVPQQGEQEQGEQGQGEQGQGGAPAARPQEPSAGEAVSENAPGTPGPAEPARPGPVEQAAARSGPSRHAERTAARAGPARPAAFQGVSPAARRARVLQARRRTLFTLVALTIGTVAITAVGVAAWWLSLPPVVLLGGFVLLLREASAIDTQRSRARATSRRPAEAPAARTAPPAAPAATAPAEAAPAPEPPPAEEDGARPGAGGYEWVETEPAAEVIDISVRIGDQLYDQYSDAKARAIGD